MPGAIPSPLQYAFTAWCSEKKHRDNFTFYLKGNEDVLENGGTAFFTSAVDGEWSALRSSRLIPGEKNRRYPLDRRLRGPQTRWRRGKNPIIVPAGNVTPVVQPVP
jgi:hypothetical protein